MALEKTKGSLQAGLTNSYTSKPESSSKEKSTSELKSTKKNSHGSIYHSCPTHHDDGSEVKHSLRTKPKKDGKHARKRSVSMNFTKEDIVKANVPTTKKGTNLRKSMVVKLSDSDSDELNEVDQPIHQGPPLAHSLSSSANPKLLPLDSSLHVDINMNLQQRLLELRSTLAHTEDRNKEYEADLNLFKNSSAITKIFELKDLMEEATTSVSFPKYLPNSFSRSSFKKGSQPLISKPLSPSFFRPLTPKTSLNKFPSSPLRNDRARLEDSDNIDPSHPNIPMQVFLSELQSVAEMGEKLLHQVSDLKQKNDVEVSKRSKSEAKINQLEEKLIHLASIEGQLHSVNEELWKECQQNEKHQIEKREMELELKSLNNQSRQKKAKLDTNALEIEQLRFEIQTLKDTALETQIKNDNDLSSYRKSMAALARENKSHQEKVRSLERELGMLQQTRLQSPLLRDPSQSTTTSPKVPSSRFSCDTINASSEGAVFGPSKMPSLNFNSESLMEQNKKLSHSLQLVEATKKRYKKKLQEQNKVLLQYQNRMKKISKQDLEESSSENDGQEWHFSKRAILSGASESELEDSELKAFSAAFPSSTTNFDLKSVSSNVIKMVEPISISTDQNTEIESFDDQPFKGINSRPRVRALRRRRSSQSDLLVHSRLNLKKSVESGLTRASTATLRKMKSNQDMYSSDDSSSKSNEIEHNSLSLQLQITSQDEAGSKYTDNPNKLPSQTILSSNQQSPISSEHDTIISSHQKEIKLDREISHGGSNVQVSKNNSSVPELHTSPRSKNPSPKLNIEPSLDFATSLPNHKLHSHDKPKDDNLRASFLKDESTTNFVSDLDKFSHIHGESFEVLNHETPIFPDQEDQSQNDDLVKLSTLHSNSFVQMSRSTENLSALEFSDAKLSFFDCKSAEIETPNSLQDCSFISASNQLQGADKASVKNLVIESGVTTMLSDKDSPVISNLDNSNDKSNNNINLNFDNLCETSIHDRFFSNDDANFSPSSPKNINDHAKIAQEIDVPAAENIRYLGIETKPATSDSKLDVLSHVKELLSLQSTESRNQIQDLIQLLNSQVGYSNGVPLKQNVGDHNPENDDHLPSDDPNTIQDFKKNDLEIESSLPSSHISSHPQLSLDDHNHNSPTSPTIPPIKSSDSHCIHDGIEDTSQNFDVSFSKDYLNSDSSVEPNSPDVLLSSKTDEGVSIERPKENHQPTLSFEVDQNSLNENILTESQAPILESSEFSTHFSETSALDLELLPKENTLSNSESKSSVLRNQSSSSQLSVSYMDSNQDSHDALIKSPIAFSYALEWVYTVEQKALELGNGSDGFAQKELDIALSQIRSFLQQCAQSRQDNNRDPFTIRTHPSKISLPPLKEERVVGSSMTAKISSMNERRIDSISEKEKGRALAGDNTSSSPSGFSNRLKTTKSSHESVGAQFASVIQKIASRSSMKNASIGRTAQRENANLNSRFDPEIQSSSSNGLRRHASLSAVVNQNPQVPNNPSFTHSTDDAVVLGITQAMSGEYLYKFVRSTTFATEVVHRRFFWLNPYTRVLAWARREPEHGIGKHSPRQVYVRAVEEVDDEYSHSSIRGGNSKAILVYTNSSQIRIKADSLTRHELWFTALSYVQHHMTDDFAKDSRERLWKSHKPRSNFVSKGDSLQSVNSLGSHNSVVQVDSSERLHLSNSIAKSSTSDSINTSGSLPAKEFINKLSHMRSFSRT